MTLYEDTQIGDVQDRYGIKYAIMKSFKDGRNADVEPRPLTEEHVKAFLRNELEDIALDSSAVEQCIVGRFMRMQFPEPKGGGIVIVSYPFIFSPG